MAVAKQVLAAQKHLQRRFRHEFLEGAQPLPGVFVQVADAGVVGRPAPALDRPVPRLVEVGAGSGHVVDAKPCGDEALMGIAQGKLGNINNSWFHECLSGEFEVPYGMTPVNRKWFPAGSRRM